MERSKAIRTLEAANSEVDRLIEAVRWTLTCGDEEAVSLVGPHFIDVCSEPARQALASLYHENARQIKAGLAILFLKLAHMKDKTRASRALILFILGKWGCRKSSHALLQMLIIDPSPRSIIKRYLNV